MNILLRTTRLGIVMGALLSGTLAMAQHVAVANIPFPFEANHKAMPAGKYFISQMSNRAVFEVNNWRGDASAVMAGILNTNRDPENGRLTFLKSGDRRILCRIAMPGGATEFGVGPDKLDKVQNRNMRIASMINVPLGKR